MSLTSYRAAPPRVGGPWAVGRGPAGLVGRRRRRRCGAPGSRRRRRWRRRRLARPGGPAAAYSPASWDAVPWALGRFTAEFGMGSGVSSPRWPPGHRAGPAPPHARDRVSGARARARARCPRAAAGGDGGGGVPAAAPRRARPRVCVARPSAAAARGGPASCPLGALSGD